MQQSFLLLAGIASLASASPAQANHPRQESESATATAGSPCEYNLRTYLLNSQPTLAPVAAEWFYSSMATRSSVPPITHTSQIGPLCTSIIEFKNTFTAPPAVKSAYSSWLEEHSSWVEEKKDGASSILAGCTSAQFASLSHSALRALATDVAGCEKAQSASFLYTPTLSSGANPSSTSTYNTNACEYTLSSIIDSKPTRASEFAAWASSSQLSVLSSIRTQTTATPFSVTHVSQLSSICSAQYAENQAYPTTFTAAPKIKSWWSSYSSAIDVWRTQNEELVRSVVYTACPQDSAPPGLRLNAFSPLATDVAGCVELQRLLFGNSGPFATETSTYGQAPSETTGTAAQQTQTGTTSTVTAGAARETGLVVVAAAVAAAVAAL